MIPTILGLIQATSLQRVRSQQLLTAVQAAPRRPTLSQSIPCKAPGTGSAASSAHARETKASLPTDSLLLGSCSKFPTAALGWNKLPPLTAVSLASLLSQAQGAQQGWTASLFPPPCRQPQRIPQMCFSIANLQQHLKEAMRSRNQFRSNTRSQQSGQMHLVSSRCTSMTIFSAQPFGSKNSSSFF